MAKSTKNLKKTITGKKARISPCKKNFFLQNKNKYIFGGRAKPLPLTKKIIL